ncbi:Zinc ion binding protein [Forsythia ovata]|uniref:Zinc ion binding protein n=1 Tax=Forsythia ovata TaxID=205694 RepID=A0ABD1UZ89_9LAMI
MSRLRMRRRVLVAESALLNRSLGEGLRPLVGEAGADLAMGGKSNSEAAVCKSSETALFGRSENFGMGKELRGGYRNLNPEVEEGICQVLSHMWLESEVTPGSRNMPSTSTASSSSTRSYGATSMSSTSTASSSSSSSSKKGYKSSTENNLGAFFMHQIAQ